MRRGNQSNCRLSVQVGLLLPQILFSIADLSMSVLCEEMDQCTNFEREDEAFFVTSCQLRSSLFSRSGLNYLNYAEWMGGPQNHLM